MGDVNRFWRGTQTKSSAVHSIMKATQLLPVSKDFEFFILGFSVNVDLFNYFLSVFIMKLIVSIHELSFPGLLPGYLIYLFQVVKTTPVGSGDEAGVRCVCDVQYYGASGRCFIHVRPPPTARGKEALNILTVCSSHPTPRV